MNKTKKIIGIMMCVVLAFGCLTGCGKKSDEELLMSAVTSVNSAKSFDMTTKLSGKMKIEIAKQSEDVDMAMNMTATRFSDPVKVKTVTNTETAGTKQTSESYVQKDGDNYVVYTKANNAWSKANLGNVDDAMKQAGFEDFSSQFSGDVSKYKKQEDKKEGDKSYLVYNYTLSSEDIKGMMEGMSSSMSSLFGSGSDSEKLLDTIVKSMGNITMTIWIDRDEESIYKVECSLTEMMNKLFKGLLDEISKSATKNSKDKTSVDLAQALASAKFTASDMNMVSTYSNLNKAADFEVPAEAKSAKEISASGATTAK